MESIPFHRMPPAEFITLRDQFAMAAMPAILGEFSFVDPNGSRYGDSSFRPEATVPQYERITRLSYEMADAMMKEREK